MPRPKRTKVASTRVGDDYKSSTVNPNVSKAGVTRRGSRAQRIPIQTDQNLSENADNTNTTDVVHREPPLEPLRKQTQSSALERLRERQAQSSSIVISPASHRPVEVENARSARQASRVANARNSSSSLGVTFAIVENDHAAMAVRETRETPQRDFSLGLSEDLYGLSPSGERSQLELQNRAQSLQGSEQTSVKPSLYFAPASTQRRQPTPSQDFSHYALTNFRRRTRQPSILRTRNRTSIQSQSVLNDDLGFELDLEDFEPDDESTPLKLMREGLALSPATAEATVATTSSRKRKLRSLELQAVRSSPHAEHAQDEYTQPEESDDPESLPHARPEPVTEDLEPVDESDTMAPPRSSSSLEELYGHDSPRKESAPAAPAIRTRRSTRSAPNAKSSKTQRFPGPSTASLEKLLPQRMMRNRRARQEAFEIPSSDPSEEENRLTSEKQGRKAKKGTRPRTPALSSPVQSRRKVNHNRVQDVKSLATSRKGATKKTTASRTITRTYGRPSGASDKENEESTSAAQRTSEDDFSDNVPFPDSNKRPTTLTATNNPELAAIAAKFAEIDDWQMEVESVDTGGNDSGSWR